MSSEHLGRPDNGSSPTVLPEGLSGHVLSLAAGVVAARRRTRGLPVAPLQVYPEASSLYCTTTTIDNRGRLADRSFLRVLGWKPGTPVSITVRPGQVVVVTRSPGPAAITEQGHLRLSAAVRHTCRLSPGARLLVVGFPDLDVLTAYSTTAVEAMLLNYHAALGSEPRS